MGLGSKSPFAYTDSFSVESFYCGVRRVYNAYKNEQEEPVFALLSTEDTDEPNGLMIRFAVKSDAYDNDFDEFYEEAQTIYEFFPVKPKVTGKDIEIEETEYIFESGNWGIRKHWGNHECRAIMGNIAYPIDRDNVGLGENDEGIKHLLDGMVDIHFEIGELNITPSRESLSYNQYTKDSIIKRAKEVVAEMAKLLTHKFDGCETLWDARVLYSNLCKTGNLLNSITGVFNKDDVNWNGTKLFEGYHLNVKVGDIPDIECRRFNKTTWKKSIEVSKDVGSLPVDDDTVIFINDAVGAISRCKRYCEDIYTEEGNRPTVFLVNDLTEDGSGLKAFVERLGINPDLLKRASSLERASRSYSGGGYSVQRSKVCQYNGNTSWGTAGDNWDDVDIDLSEGGVYVEIHRYKAQLHSRYPNEYEHPRVINKILSSLEGLGHELKTPVYGIKPAMLRTARFTKHEYKWVKLTDFVDEILNKYLYEQEWNNRFKDLEASKDELFEFDIMESIASSTKSDNLIKDYVAQNSELENCREIYTKAKHLAYYNNHRIKYDDNYESLDGVTKLIRKRYPMLGLLAENVSYLNTEGEEVRRAAEYVDFVEQHLNLEK